MRQCSKCGLTKVDLDFPVSRRCGKVYRRFICKTCWRAVKRVEYKQGMTRPDYKERKHKRNLGWHQKEHEERMGRTNQAKFITQDAKRDDSFKGRPNDLTEEFVKSLLTGICSYCLTTPVQPNRLGLDRMDSSKGHIQANVVVACSRCNFLKRDMPYEAWLILIPSIREAAKAGLFSDWVGGWMHGNKQSTRAV